MRLKLSPLPKFPKHTDLVSGIGLLSSEEIISAGDDQQILRWNPSSNETSNLAKLPENVYVTDLDIFPSNVSSTNRKTPGADLFVLASTEGKFHLIARSGRFEKSVEAHRGAILSVRWSWDGNALATSGEDGQVKVWSRSGMLRSTLSQNNYPVYSLAWGSDGDQIVYTIEKQLVIKSLQATAKPTSWRAHDGVILKVDWNSVNALIASGGEDCRYKVWDSYGRPMYSGAVQDYPITALAWAPDGTLFAVGSYNTIRLCDAAGWSYSVDKCETGSLMNIAWSSDSTQLAGVGGNGHVLFGQVTEKQLEWKHFEATVTDERAIRVRNVVDDAIERLEFRDRVVKVSLEFGHLVVCTAAQCYTYSTRNWNTPAIFDLKEGRVKLIVQAEKHFGLVDGTGVYVYSYEGRLVCNPRYTGMRTDLLHSGTISITNDTIAIRDNTEEHMIYLFDAANGKPLGDGKPISHQCDVHLIALDQCGSAAERKIAVVDKNRDLFLMSIRVYGNQRKTAKLGTMVESVAWNDVANMIAALGNGKLTVWYYPNSVFVNKLLLPRTAWERESSEFGKQPELKAFIGNHLFLRRGEGSLISTGISPYPAVLHQYVAAGKWSEATSLCRFLKDETIWACLAGMATYAKDLTTAEIAYAAINEADKVEYIQYIKELPLKEARNAEMLLLSGNYQDAEGVYLQAGFMFRAIMQNITLYNWDRALELAIKHKTHIDTVLAYRGRFIERMGRKETNKKFIEYAKEVAVDWEKVTEKIMLEYEKELAHADKNVARR